MRLTIAAITLGFVLVSRISAADDGPEPTVGALRIDVDGYASWAAAVSALQGDTASEGRTLPVRVSGAGEFVRCGAYELRLDEVAARAFEIGTCDPRSRSTAVRLVHRALLFAPGDIVPQPLSAGISAVQMLTGGAAGGAGQNGGSEALCTVALQPFLTDLEHGTHVALTPPRFGLHIESATIGVATDANGWLLTGHSGGSIAIEYEVRDTLHNNALVLRDRATLACAVSNANAAPTPHDWSLPSTPRAEALAATVARTSAPDASTLLTSTAIQVSPAPTFLRGVVIAGAASAGSIGYIPLGGVRLHSGETTATGTEAGIASAWLTGTSGGASFDLMLISVGVDFAEMFNARAHETEARLTLATNVHITPSVSVLAGVTTAIGDLELLDQAGRNWSTGLVTGYGITAGVRVRGPLHWNSARTRAQFTEVDVVGFAPAFGVGVWTAGIAIHWGTGR